MADGVARSPSRPCSKRREDLLLWRRLEYDFLAFIFSVFLRLWSSHLLLSASTYFIVRVLSACVISTLPHLGVLLFLSFSFLFSWLLFLGWRFFVISYPVR